MTRETGHRTGFIRCARREPWNWMSRWSPCHYTYSVWEPKGGG